MQIIINWRKFVYDNDHFAWFPYKSDSTAFSYSTVLRAFNMIIIISEHEGSDLPNYGLVGNFL